jgi:uncharacterized protein
MVTRATPNNSAPDVGKYRFIETVQATDPNPSAEPRDLSQELVTINRLVESGRGKVSVSYSLPKSRNPSMCSLIAHGVKGSMNSPLVTYFHSALAAQGFLTVKFNFPYAEPRTRFLRRPDRKDTLIDCYRRVLDDVLHSQWEPRIVFLGGVSLGAAVASHIVSDGPNISQVKGLFFLSYPLHRAGSPDERGEKHLHRISKPMLFVSGTRDPYAEPRVLRSILSELGAKAQVHWVEGTDYSFDKHKGKEIYAKTLQEIVETIAKWANSESATK